MRFFRMSKFTVQCESKNCRNGFKHVAVLYVGSTELSRSTCHYQNRTWEAFQFQSVLRQLISEFDDDDRMSKRQRNLFSKKFELGV